MLKEKSKEGEWFGDGYVIDDLDSEYFRNGMGLIWNRDPVKNQIGVRGCRPSFDHESYPWGTTFAPL